MDFVSALAIAMGLVAALCFMGADFEYRKRERSRQRRDRADRREWLRRMQEREQILDLAERRRQQQRRG